MTVLRRKLRRSGFTSVTTHQSNRDHSTKLSQELTRFLCLSSHAEAFSILKDNMWPLSLTYFHYPSKITVMMVLRYLPTIKKKTFVKRRKGIQMCSYVKLRDISEWDSRFWLRWKRGLYSSAFWRCVFLCVVTEVPSECLVSCCHCFGERMLTICKTSQRLDL